MADAGWLAPLDIPRETIVDKNIHKLCMGPGRMIRPYLQEHIYKDSVGLILSYGLSSTGYIFRLGEQFLDPIPDGGALPPKALDIKKISARDYFNRVELPSGSEIALKANGSIFGQTLEYVSVPDDVVVEFTAKPAITRAGLLVTAPRLEGGYEGYVSLALYNTNPFAVMLYPGEGIVHGSFTKIGVVPAHTYRHYRGEAVAYTLDTYPPVPSVRD